MQGINVPPDRRVLELERIVTYAASARSRPNLGLESSPMVVGSCSTNRPIDVPRLLIKSSSLLGRCCEKGLSMDLQLLSVGLDGLESQRCGSLFALNCASIPEAKGKRYSDACVMSLENPRVQSAVALDVWPASASGKEHSGYPNRAEADV